MTHPCATYAGSRVTMMFRRTGSGRPMDSYVLRPMITGWPDVIFLKRWRSSGMCHKSLFAFPIARFAAAIALMILTRGLFMANILDSNRRFDWWVRIGPLQRKVLEAKTENILHIRIDRHTRQRTRRARKLFTHLVDVVVIDVHVAERVHKITYSKIGHVRDHHREQRV